MLPKISQYPETGKHLLRYCGDTLEIRMRCDRKVTGTAFLSTNIGNASTPKEIQPSGITTLVRLEHSLNA